jgi:hypothetical protein
VVMVVIMVVMVIMVMVVIMLMIVVLAVMMQVGGHDTRQADRIMWMVVAVTAAIVCRGRSREERDCAETRYRGSSKNEGVIGHVCSLRKAVPQRPSQEVVPMDEPSGAVVCALTPADACLRGLKSLKKGLAEETEYEGKPESQAIAFRDNNPALKSVRQELVQKSRTGL